MFILYEGLYGNLGNIVNFELFMYSKIGIKYLIQEFIDQVVSVFEQIYIVDEDVVDFYDKFMFFEEIVYVYGCSCLMLFGGVGLGFFYCGVVKLLNEQNLLFFVIFGVSVGLIIGGMLVI